MSFSPAPRHPKRRCVPRSARRAGGMRPGPSRLSSPPPRCRPAARERVVQIAAVRLTSPPSARWASTGRDRRLHIHEYALSSREGVALMPCLAEALLRIPDTGTIDRLIRDRLASADWERHLGHSGSLFVNASTWALMLTGRLLGGDDGHDLGGALHRFAGRSAEPVVRQAVLAAMRILGRQFVMGRTIEEALSRAAASERHGYRHSYDMLGEAARTADDAARYHAAYRHAIDKIGAAAAGRAVTEAPGISVNAVSASPALRAGPARSGDAGTLAAPDPALPRGQGCECRPDGGCGVVRPARLVARSVRGRRVRPGPVRDGTVLGSRWCRPIRNERWR